jgi:hypothetical protein
LPEERRLGDAASEPGTQEEAPGEEVEEVTEREPTEEERSKRCPVCTGEARYDFICYLAYQPLAHAEIDENR